MRSAASRAWIGICLLLLLQACRHPLAIEGEGDIVERLQGNRGCTLEQFRGANPACTDNDVTGSDYVVSYEPVPRPGWVFTGWEGTACGGDSVYPFCDYAFGANLVAFVNATWPGFSFGATTAVFKQPQDAIPDIFEHTIAEPILAARCMACHVEGGVSGLTRLVFDNSMFGDTIATNVAVLQDFVDNVDNGADLILTKVRGGAGHGGGSVFGSGSEEYAALIDMVNQQRDTQQSPVVAIDIPSGLDCDAGTAAGACIRADLTVTFVSTKVGFEQSTAREFCGDIEVVDIGAPRFLLEDIFSSAPLSAPADEN